MISQNHQDHDELLMRIVTGDESPESEAARSLFASCEHCRADYAEMSAVQAALDEDALNVEPYEAGPKAPLSASNRNALAALRASIGPTVKSEVAVPDNSEPLRFTKRWALAAALLVAAAGAAFLGKRYQLTPKEDEPGRRGDTLGGKREMEFVFPVKDVDRVDHFTVAFRRDPGSIVFVVRDPRTGETVIKSDPQRSTTWEPAESKLKLLPAEFEWSVSIVNATGDAEEGENSWCHVSVRGGGDH